MHSNSHATGRNRLLFLLSGCLLLLLCAIGGALALLLTQSAWQTEVAQTDSTIATPAATTTGQPNVLPPVTVESLVAPQQATAPQPPTSTLSPSPTPAYAIPSSIVQQPAALRTFTDLERLLDARYPARDYFETAVTLGRRDLGRRQFERAPFQKGERQVFRTADGTVEATLLATSTHATFWVEDGLTLSDSAVDEAAQRFEAYYIRLTGLFGTEWRPGIDGDPRFTILHLASAGNPYELGYFSDMDEYPRTLFSDSNEQEIVYLNMGQLTLGSDLYFGTLIHEVQHLIQWHVDKNEATWLNEGLSQLAELYVGLDTARTAAYQAQPDIQLNRWSYTDGVIDAHYAASYLYTVYLWEQLGETAVAELIRQPANGLAAVHAVLQNHATGRSLEQFTADWAVANFLDDAAAGPSFAYTQLDLERPLLQTRVRQLPFEDNRTANQYGAHYIDIDHTGPLTLTFAADTLTPLIGAPPPSGEQMWFVPPVDDTHAQLTGRFDLRDVASATLEFSTWYDLEKEYDYGYVAVSVDNGASWTLLPPRQAVLGEYGAAFNGRSAAQPAHINGWVRETIPLDAYVGQEVLVRFHVLTDFENTRSGFALDDITIPEIGFADDVEGDVSGWLAEGFVVTGWQLPQQWMVRLIQHGATPQVLSLPLDAGNRLQTSVEIGPGGATLVVLAATPFSDKPARYWLFAE